jgi:hypothetical protein
MNQYPLTRANIKKENEIIKEILNNDYLQQNIYQKQKPPRTNVEQKKWIAFTYFGPETRAITKLFRNTNIGIAYRTRNNIKPHLRVKKNTTDRFNLRGVYQLQYKECSSRYIGQTGRTFKTRYKEHIRDV